ncbi:ferric reductase-like transmembrane domain-containing protein [Pelagibacterium sp. 26DY04]|uniref:sulfite oxidase heme-binding subunit YedZ n=1 Tax=Pelagibacterium sp. 26DY04 TaxID=2967130 RepID=UPI002814C02B|nr:ferric reductase-like transmembrane domain-containing protein [Pelagibacterium sp. 26DY04]WMT86522.1 ferric reductase-like transmembrane domain-containing protein [Pelagibacterium sp. 26DY04]
MSIVPSEFRNPPWRLKNDQFSPLKLTAFVGMFIPAVLIAHGFLTAQFHLRPTAWLLYWSGVWATILLLATLFVTPARKLFRWGKLIHIRRTVGVGAFAYTLVHVYYFAALEQFDPPVLVEEVGERFTLMVALVSFVGLSMLAGTSFDAAVQKLGGQTWQRLHYLIYPTVALAIFHFLLSPSSAGGLPFTFTGVFIWLMVWRILDRRGLGSDPVALFVLGLCVTFGTAIFEATWAGTVHGLDPWLTLSFNFSLILGISAGWQVFAMSMIVAVIAMWRLNLVARPVQSYHSQSR